MNIKYFGLAVVIIIGVGYFLMNNAKTEVVQVANTEAENEVKAPQLETEDTEVDSTTESADTPTQIEESSEPEPEPTPAPTKPASGKYTAYDESQIANSNADNIFLFFHATWCPSCRALEKDVMANMANLPEGVEIYKVDYDTAVALKKQYSINLQHSVIEISSDGTALSKVSHPPTLNSLLAGIN